MKKKELLSRLEQLELQFKEHRNNQFDENKFIIKKLEKLELYNFNEGPINFSDSESVLQVEKTNLTNIRAEKTFLEFKVYTSFDTWYPIIKKLRDLNKTELIELKKYLYNEKERT